MDAMEWSVEQLDEKCSETVKPGEYASVERGCVDSLEVGSMDPRQMVKQWSPKRTPLLTETVNHRNGSAGAKLHIPHHTSHTFSDENCGAVTIANITILLGT